MICFIAGLAFFQPAWSEVLIYDRSAMQQGELWRLWTGHLVHFSRLHLLLDLLTFGIAAAIVESCHGNRGRGVMIAIAGCLSLGLYLLEPAVARFGGLSGMATSMMLLAVFSLMHSLPAFRQAGHLMIGLIYLKVVVEIFLPATTLATMADAAILKLPLSHALGALLALTPLYRFRWKLAPVD